MSHRVPRRSTTRIRAAIIAAAALSMAACGAGAASSPSNSDEASGELTQVNVAFDFMLTVQNAGLFVADDAGYFAEEGIEPNFMGGGGSSPAPEVAIAAGQAQIGFESNTSRLFTYLADEDDIVIIGQLYQQPPNGLLSLKDRPVRDVKELSGARIMGPPTNQSFIDGLMDLNDVTDYAFVPGGGDIGALQSGQADAMLAFATNQPIALEQQGLTAGEDFFFTPLSDLNYHVIAGVIIASRAFVEENRDLVVGYLRAEMRGLQDAIADPAAAAELTVSEYITGQGLDVAVEEEKFRTQIPLMTSPLTDSHGLLAIDPAVIESQVFPGLIAAGVTNLPDVSTIFDLTLQEDAQKSLLEDAQK